MKEDKKDLNMLKYDEKKKKKEWNENKSLRLRYSEKLINIAR